MQKILIICALIGLFLACKKSEMENMNMMPAEIPMATVSQKGQFMNAAHPTSGQASVQVDPSNAKIRNLQVDNFKTDSGPDLRVYLAEDLKAKGFIELAKLPKTSGSFTVSIPEQADLQRQKFLLIWCEDFSVNFGYAELK